MKTAIAPIAIAGIALAATLTASQIGTADSDLRPHQEVTGELKAYNRMINYAKSEIDRLESMESIGSHRRAMLAELRRIQTDLQRKADAKG